MIKTTISLHKLTDEEKALLEKHGPEIQARIARAFERITEGVLLSAFAPPFRPKVTVNERPTPDPLYFRYRYGFGIQEPLRVVGTLNDDEEVS